MNSSVVCRPGGDPFAHANPAHAGFAAMQFLAVWLTQLALLQAKLLTGQARQYPAEVRVIYLGRRTFNRIAIDYVSDGFERAHSRAVKVAVLDWAPFFISIDGNFGHGRRAEVSVAPPHF